MAQETKKRAAIYIRCSSDEAKKEGYSPTTQEKTATKAIDIDGNELNKEYIYKDIGHSGGTDKRPGLQKLLEEARAKKFDIVYVSRMDRFFRNLSLLIKTVNELKSLGVEFKSSSESFDTATPTGRAMFHMAGIFAEWQREVGLEARDAGMIRAMRAGKWLGGTPPLGYKFNEDTQRLEINQEETRIVKMLYKWLVEEKLSVYKIQQRINAMKIPTKYDRLGKSNQKKTKSKCWWNRRTISRVLKNEIYTGKFYYRKRKYLGRVRGKNNLRPKEDWIRVEDPNLKIISRKLFEKAQEQLKKNKELAIRNTKQIYTLQHKIICGFDGYRYQSATRHYKNKDGSPRETKYYFCVGKRPYLSPKKCLAPTISESRILPPVWEKLKQTLTNPEIIMQKLEEYLNQGNKGNQIQKQLNNIKNAFISTNTKRERYAELYTEGSVTKDFYDKKIQQCEKEAESLRKEEEKLSQLLLTEEEKEKRIDSVKELYHKLKERLENTTYEVKREILQRLVEKITKTDNRLDIEFNIPLVDYSDRRRMD